MIALAALTATNTRATTASSAKLHPRSAAAVTSHTAHSAHSQVGARVTPPAARSRISTRRTLRSATHRPSAEQVGREAGLAIRRQRARRMAMRRPLRARAVSYQIRRIHRSGVRAESIAPAETSGDLSAPQAAETGATPPDTGTIAPTAAEPGLKAPIAEDDSTPSERATAGVPAMPADTRESGISPVAANGIAPADDSTRDEDQGPPPTEATSVTTETEEASLYVPRSARLSPLRGSLESLQRQNARLDAEGLERIEDEDDLAARIADGLLVPLPASAALTVNSELLANHRYCRPWTAKFLADLARAHQAAFHMSLEVSSAVRTVEYQQRLMRINGNAAAAEGDIVSPHLTGATVDIAKSGLSRREMTWMRQHLLALQTAGKIDVEEEFRQACFHITVYKDYAPEHKTKPRRRAAPSADDEAGATEGL